MALDWRHVWLLGVAHVRNTMTGGRGIAFLVMFALLGAIIAIAIIRPITEIAAVLGADLDAQVARELWPVVSWWIDGTGPNDPRVLHLLVDKPAIISGVLVVLAGFMPFVAVTASANQLSRDIANKGLRYMLLRTERINILMSRMLASWFIVSLSTLVLVLMVGLYVGGSFDYVPMGDALLWSLQGWLALTWVALPYVSLCALISCLIPIPAASTIVSLLITGITPLLLYRVGHDLKLDWFEKLGPWAWKYHLLDPTAGEVGLAAGVMTGFALFVLSIAIVYFGRRNL